MSTSGVIQLTKPLCTTTVPQSGNDRSRSTFVQTFAYAVQHCTMTLFIMPWLGLQCTDDGRVSRLFASTYLDRSAMTKVSFKAWNGYFVCLSMAIEPLAQLPIFEIYLPYYDTDHIKCRWSSASKAVIPDVLVHQTWFTTVVWANVGDEEFWYSSNVNYQHSKDRSVLLHTLNLGNLVNKQRIKHTLRSSTCSWYKNTTHTLLKPSSAVDRQWFTLSRSAFSSVDKLHRSTRRIYRIVDFTWVQRMIMHVPVP